MRTRAGDDDHDDDDHEDDHDGDDDVFLLFGVHAPVSFSRE